MVNWIDHADESYNPKTFCFGGLIATEKHWERLAKECRDRLALENRRSAKSGFKPITRYHATDCGNLKREFSKANGWDIPRQIRLTSKLCRMVSQSKPFGIVIGSDIATFKKNFPGPDYLRSLYAMTFQMHLVWVGRRMLTAHPHDRVSVIYDRTKNFGPIAQVGFKDFMEDPGVSHISKFFLTCAPMASEDCLPLQAADLFAYEGMKHTHKYGEGSEDVRKALKAILGKDMPVFMGRYSDKNYKDAIRMMENQNAGRHMLDGVKLLHADKDQSGWR